MDESQSSLSPSSGISGLMGFARKAEKFNEGVRHEALHSFALS